MNEFIKDSRVFLRACTSTISPKMDQERLILCVMNLALGIERILKGVLFDVNPLYVLMNPDFKNSMSVSYPAKILNVPTAKAELAKNPDHDVITFRNSLLRAQCCSATTLANKGLLFAISEYRDIIAHHMLSRLDPEMLRTLLLRDTFSLLAAFANELGINRGHFFNNHDIRLGKIASPLQKDVAEQLSVMIDTHRRRWASLSKTPGYAAEKDAITKEILSTPLKFAYPCPACGKTAVIYGQAEREYNLLDKAEVTIGLKVKKLSCQYCKLLVEDYDQIDHLKLYPAIEQ